MSYQWLEYKFKILSSPAILTKIKESDWLLRKSALRDNIKAKNNFTANWRN